MTQQPDRKRIAKGPEPRRGPELPEVEVPHVEVDIEIEPDPASGEGIDFEDRTDDVRRAVELEWARQWVRGRRDAGYLPN